MGQRRRAREHALQMLFQIDLSGAEPAEVFEGFWRERSGDDAEARAFAERLVLGVRGGRAELDRRIGECAEHWRVERMAIVDRNVLRMAVHEMLGDPPAPPAVAIDEAIEVARKFGGEESGRFVNGILDSIRKRIGAPGS